MAAKVVTNARILIFMLPAMEQIEALLATLVSSFRSFGILYKRLQIFFICRPELQIPDSYTPKKAIPQKRNGHSILLAE